MEGMVSAEILKIKSDFVYFWQVLVIAGYLTLSGADQYYWLVGHTNNKSRQKAEGNASGR